MNKKPEKEIKISRRKIFPILGSTLLIPFLGISKSFDTDTVDNELVNNEEYEILLKPDGTTVKVKKSALKRSKVVKKNISNRSFLNWLGKKD